MDLLALPYIIFQGSLFGSTLVASRFGVGQFAPTTYIGLRLILASLGHLAIYASSYGGRTWPRDRRLWKHAIVIGVIGTAIPLTSIVSSLQYQSSGVTSILLTANPAFIVLLAHFLLPDEKLNRRKVLGIGLALTGGLLLILRGETGLAEVERASPIGYGLVFLGMLGTASMMIYVRKYMQGFDPFDVASVRMFTAAVLVMPLSVLLVGFDLSRVDTQGVFALVYAAIAGTFLGMMVQFYNVQRFGATASVMAVYVIPVVASLGGALILDERITGGMLVGMLLIAAGVWLVNRQPD